MKNKFLEAKELFVQKLKSKLCVAFVNPKYF